MLLRDVLNRYAILQNLTDRTVVLYGHTLDRFAEFVKHEPTIDDIDDLIVAGFLRRKELGNGKEKSDEEEACDSTINRSRLESVAVGCTCLE